MSAKDNFVKAKVRAEPSLVIDGGPGDGDCLAATFDP
jgi:hypothetical protein